MTVIDYLEQAVERFPEKTAFTDAERSITYTQLREASASVATGLSHRLGCANQPVMVLVDRNVESVCALLGVAMSRNFYVPVDAAQPLQRARTILDQMRPEAIISVGNISPELFESAAVPVLEYTELVETPADEALLKDLRQHTLDSDPLYAICTSGSTGVPKGVVKTHRSVVSFIPVFAETFGFDENEIFGNQAPFDFDVSAKDIYSTLYCGASTFIIPRVCFSMPKKLVEALDERRVTTLTWSVSALCVAAGFNAFRHRVPSRVKKVLFSGEVMPIKMLNIWRRYLPDAMFVNLYGPTEVTGNSLYYIVDREFDNTEKLPLGVPFRNGEVHFLNEENRDIQTGEQGEICILSTSMALGYYRDFEKTAAAFVQNPLNDRYPERMYRTGDLAELREDGQYYFAARKDFQIKHMGHRIELEEIETFLNAVDGVSRASCLFDTQRNKIVACYVGDVDKGEIVNCLKANLPKYMIPNIFLPMEQLPMNQNGKIDRQRLRQMYEQGR